MLTTAPGSWRISTPPSVSRSRSPEDGQDPRSRTFHLPIHISTSTIRERLDRRYGSDLLQYAEPEPAEQDVSKAEARDAVLSIEVSDEVNAGIVMRLTAAEIEERMEQRTLPREYSPSDVAFQHNGEWVKLGEEGELIPLFDLPKDDVIIIRDPNEIEADEGYDSESDDEWEDPDDGDYAEERCTEKGKHVMKRANRKKQS